MKLPNMNNVYVYHKGREISISHHRDKGYPSPDEREVAVIPDKDRGETYANMYIERYRSSLDSLIDELIKVRDTINEKEND